ncbi:hypothetical protein ACHQM5_001573 [Ranunculus cassubicifolius]
MENPSEAEVQEVVGSGFTCEICYEPVDSNNRFENKTKTCSHDSYCVDCIGKYIEARIQEYNTADIKCPGLECKESLDPVMCRSILPPRVFDLWCDALSESLFAKEGVYRSYCPNPDCSTAYFSDCKNIFKVKCSKCKGLFCFKCKIPWALGHECHKYMERVDIDDTAFEGLVAEKKWGRCPQCGYVVERRSGCSFMSCRCGTSFCYKTGKILTNHDCRCLGCQEKLRTVVCCCCTTCLVLILLVIGFIILVIMLSRK